MKVLVVGALGDLGLRVSELLGSNHEVWGLTRSQGRAHLLEDHGLRPVVGDLLDPASIRDACAAAAPDAVVSVPIALPQRGPIRPRDLRSTDRLRVEGTRNLLEASLESGVKRFVAESIVAIYGYGQSPRTLDESSPTQRRAPLRALQPTLDAIHAQEQMVLRFARDGAMEGIVVRLGFYYGRGVGSTEFMTKLLRRRLLPLSRRQGALPWVELSDAAAGVSAALEKGRSGEIYNLVGDDSVGLGGLAREIASQHGLPSPMELPAWMIRLGGSYAALMSETRLHVSNQKAKQDLGWTLRFPTVRDGVAHAVAESRPSDHETRRST